MAFIDEVGSKLDDLADEQIDAAVQQVTERQFSRQAEPIDFDTAVERLRATRDAVRSALESGPLAAMPAGIQRELASLLKAAAGDVQSLSSGDDVVKPFGKHVDALDSFAWRNGLTQAKQLADLADGLTRLASLTTETAGLRDQVSSVLAQGEAIPTLAQQAQEAATAATQAQEEAQGAQQQAAQLTQQANESAAAAAEARQKTQTHSEETTQLAQQSRDAAAAATQAQQEAQSAQQQAGQSAQQAHTALTEATERNNQVNTLLGQAQSSRQQISVYEADLKTLHDEGQEFRKRIAETEEQAKSMIAETSQHAEQIIADHTSRTEALLADLAANEERITEALERATGVSLFHSFQERKKQISRAKWIWANALGVVVAGSVAAAIWIAQSAFPLTSAFYLKLAVAPLITYAVWFCTSHYNRERRLEEVYAFKSNISLSLEPYRKLVASVLPDGDEASRAKYSDFVIDTIGKVFTAPADHTDQAAPFGLDSISREKVKEFAELFAHMVHIALQGKK